MEFYGKVLNAKRGEVFHFSDKKEKMPLVLLLVVLN